MNNRHAANNFELVHDSIAQAVSVEFYDDGNPGELFLTAGKSGMQLDTSTRYSSIAVSPGTCR